MLRGLDVETVDEPRGLAFKRLSLVEISPRASHQHEFHAGQLRRALGFPESKTEGTLTLLLFDASDKDPRIEESAFTLYNAREGKPRSPEYHLYYTTTVLAEFAKENDLLILCRRRNNSPDLLGVVARAGSDLERKLSDALGRDQEAAVLRYLSGAHSGFGVVEAPKSLEVGKDLLGPLLDVSPVSIAPREEVDTFVGEVRRLGEIPDTRTMATRARAVLERIHAPYRSADEVLSAGVQAETELFFAAEQALHLPRLQALMSSEPTLEVVLREVRSIIQSRMSRRGQSLQHHFAFVLVSEGIPHSAQCTTERNNTADFVIPSCGAYHDPGYPTAQLRMVGCKSTLKDRWRQWLEEADRIEVKYGLTLDRELTESQVRQVKTKNIQLFLPKQIIREVYSSASWANLLGDVSTLVEHLRVVAA